MELDHVEAFLAIVRSGGFTRASASLHLSQPAISRRIDLLERELGAPVFERMRGGVLLSEAGRAFLPHAEALQAQLRDGIAAVHALRETSHGSVALAIVGTLASTALTTRLRKFRDRYPAVDLRIRTALSAEVSALVRRGDAALGLRYEPDRDPELVSSKVHDEPMVAVCAPDHALARRRTLDTGALAGQRWVAFPPRPGSPPEPYSSVFEHRLAAAGLRAAEIIPIDSLTAQKRMVEAGFGLALLPASAIDEELRAGTLCALRIAALRATIPIVLVHRRRAFHSAASQALRELLSRWPAPVSPRRRSSTRITAPRTARSRSHRSSRAGTSAAAAVDLPRLRSSHARGG